MCGGGSIPIEGGLAFRQGFHVGADLHETAVEHCAGNYKAIAHNGTGSGLVSDFLRWDVTQIPLRDHSVDVLISDLVNQINT